MKACFRKALVILVLVALIGPTSGAQEVDKYRFSVARGKLRRGMGYFTIRAIEVPGLAKPKPSLATLAPALNRVAAVGANSVCFSLYGFSDDAASLSLEGVGALRVTVNQITWRRMGVVCRVFGPGASEDFGYRLAAVKAAAKLLKNDVRCVYWIEGPKCGKLAAAFKEVAPGLVVAAREGGDLGVVSEEPEGKADRPVLLVGTMPAKPLGVLNYILPPDEASYEALDKAMADPAESEPWAPDNSVLSPEEREAGWIALFDGKSLDGWWVAGPNKRGFEARNGNIEWARSGGSMLLTRDRYADFILRLEWKINQGGNSGIFLRAPRANRASKIGMEFQLMGDHGKPPGAHITGAIYSVVAPLENAGRPAGEWNELEITLDGPKLKAVLNGKLVLKLDLDENEELKYRLRKGFIGIQDHGHPVCVRDIRILEFGH